MSEKLKMLISEYVDIDINTITDNSVLRSDIGLNSLDLINLAVSIEEEFGVEITDKKVVSLFTFKDLVDCIESK